MDTQARSAFIIAQAACANAEIAAMQASNASALQAGLLQPYTHNDFMQVPNKYHIGWNDVIEYLRE